MKYKTIIWDFNGTILSDMEISINAMNTVLSRRSLREIPSIEEFRRVFGFPVKDYYERVGLDFSKEPYQVPADEWIELYSEKKYDAPLIDGAREALSTLKNNKIRQIILSASEIERLLIHLDKLSISEYFDEIHGASDVYAKGKKEIARELSKRDDLFPALLIGDTDHDLECARVIGCDCCLFSGGFMSKERLSELSVPVFEKLSDIVSSIILN